MQNTKKVAKADHKKILFAVTRPTQKNGSTQKHLLAIMNKIFFYISFLMLRKWIKINVPYFSP